MINKMGKLKPIEISVYKTKEILGVFNSTKYCLEEKYHKVIYQV